VQIIYIYNIQLVYIQDEALKREAGTRAKYYMPGLCDNMVAGLVSP